MKLEISQQIFEKYSNINLHENLFSDSQVILRRRNKVNCHISQFLQMRLKTEN